MEKDIPGIYEVKKSEAAFLILGQMGFKIKKKPNRINRIKRYMCIGKGDITQ